MTDGRTVPASSDAALRAVAGLLAIGLIAGCGNVPSPALEEARMRVQAAQDDPQVLRYAPDALDEAVAALERAEAARAAAAGREEVGHLSYIAERRVDIAEALAQEKAAQEQIQQAGPRRTAVELEAERARAAELERRLAELQAEQTERGYVMTLGDVLFDIDRAELTAGGMQNVARLADFMKAYPDRSVVVEGHTDSTGDESYNLQLSELRARSVEDVLIRQGIDPARISTRGYGEAYPVASNDSSAGRQQNRRVEIVILDANQQPIPRA